MHRVRLVTASLAGSLGYWAEHPEQVPDLDLTAAVEILRATYQGDLTEAEAKELAGRSLRRRGDAR